MNSDSQLQSSVLEDLNLRSSVNAAHIGVTAERGTTWSAPGVEGANIPQSSGAGVVAVSPAARRKILTLKKHR